MRGRPVASTVVAGAVGQPAVVVVVRTCARSPAPLGCCPMGGSSWRAGEGALEQALTARENRGQPVARRAKEGNPPTAAVEAATLVEGQELRLVPDLVEKDAKAQTG